MTILRCMMLSMLAAPSLLVAQSPRPFTVTRDLRIDADKADLSKPWTATMSQSGDLLVSESDDQTIRVFGMTGPKPSIGRKGEGPGEFRNITRIGWVGDTLWALDPSNTRVSYFGPTYKLARSIPEPGAMPAINGVDPAVELYVQAALSNGDLRAIAGVRPGGGGPQWSAGVDTWSTIYLRVAPDGAFRRRLLVESPNPCRVHFSAGGSENTIVIPFCPEPLSTDWDGTSEIAMATVEKVRNGPQALRLTLIDENGTTVFTRMLPNQPGVTIPTHLRDSVVATRAHGFSRNPAMPAVTVPTTYPPARAVMIGKDGTTWLDMRIKPSGHLWYVFDRKGTTIGTVSVPENVALKAATISTAWGFEVDADGLNSVVHYKLVRPKSN